MSAPERAAQHETVARAGSRLAWFHCFAGIAGDMALGSLLDAGADLDEVSGLLRRLPIGGWALEAEPVLRGGISATRVVVRAEDGVVVRTHPHIVAMVEEARLPSRAARRALEIFGALARVEGALHRRPPEQVHFHEVGGHDAIVDVVGTACALEVLGVDEIRASAVATGTGLVRGAHGVLPNPAPAVVALLRGAPTYGRDVSVELTTPTGAAILAALCRGYGPMPSMWITATGYGAGTAEIPGLPNATQVVVGDEVTAEGAGGQPLVLLEANLDDATGEVLAHALEAAFEAGALDAWITPVVMKRGRPGHVLSALVEPAGWGPVEQAVLSETGSLGVRATHTERWASPREMQAVEVEGMRVAMKVSPQRVKAEQRDAAAVASRSGLPLREVLRRAEATWHAQHPDVADIGGGHGEVDGTGDDPDFPPLVPPPA